MTIRVTKAGIEQARKELIADGQACLLDAQIATRVEAARLRKDMRAEIKAGAPGGEPFAPLSVIARRYSSRGGIEKKPLTRLAIPVRYWWKGADNSGVMRAAIGFTGGDVVDIHGSQNSSNQLSRSWIRFAVMHQQGYSYPLSDLARTGLRWLGAKLKKQGWVGEAKYYFLRKTTTRATVPARPIVEPFLAAHRDQIVANIMSNYAAKRRGERI